jgi:membrane protein DedA with SNARE-associated domain
VSPPEPLPFLLRHPYGALFTIVLLEQLGLPLPALPVLMAAGALAGMDRIDLLPALALSIAAAVLADLVWYEAGRLRGGRILNLLCRISLEPDSCVRRTEETFGRYGPRTLIVAKFIPGLSTVAPPLAGVFRMRRAPFVMFDGAGALLWAGAGLVFGYMFSDQLERLAEQAARLGHGLVLLLAALAAGWLCWKYVDRRRFLRTLTVARISPADLDAKLSAGEDVVVVDLRHAIDVEADPDGVPGALRLTPEEIEARHREIPRDRDVVVYCT